MTWVECDHAPTKWIVGIDRRRPANTEHEVSMLPQWHVSGGGLRQLDLEADSIDGLLLPRHGAHERVVTWIIDDVGVARHAIQQELELPAVLFDEEWRRRRNGDDEIGGQRRRADAGVLRHAARGTRHD